MMPLSNKFTRQVAQLHRTRRSERRKGNDFGEGSFDTGMYVNIPFDAMLATSSKETASLRWTPLTRDGGARLERQVQLYELTSLRDPKAMIFRSFQPVEPRTGAAVFE